MPRHRRWFFPGVSLHVVQRGNGRGDIFRSDDDRNVWLWALRNACARHHVAVHAYVLMSNHFHLVATPETRESLPRAMQFIGRLYVPYYNRRHARQGGLFESRYRADHLHSERYWYNATRYIELNPVRAGLVGDPGEYRWSSYRAHAFGDANVIVTPHACYENLGSSPVARQSLWRTTCATPLSDDELWEIRRGLAKPASVVAEISHDTAAPETTLPTS